MWDTASVNRARDVIVVQRVDHLAPIALAHDEAEVTQHAELLGDGRLPHPDLARELPDRARAGTSRLRMRTRLGVASACIVSATDLAVSVDRNAGSDSKP